ncbi:MAG: hypothetical protein L0Y71_15595 [Gemmataceae bacterium]|nr:hypothetical protein [Gemmataceae bacterium]
MAIELACTCGQKLRVEEARAGERVKCPRCQALVVVAGREAFAAAAEADNAKTCPDCGKRLPTDAVVCVNCGLDLQTGRRLKTTIKKSAKKKDHAGKLSRVRLGLAFHYARLIIFLASPVVLLLAIAVGGIAGAGGRTMGLAGGALAFIVAILVVAALLSAPVLGMVGSILCVWVPSKSARSTIMVSMALDMASFGLGMVALLLTVVGVLSDAPALALVFRFVQFGLTVAAWVLFMIFLRRLALSFEEWGYADEAGSIILFGTLLVLVPPLVVVGLTVLIAGLAVGGGGLAVARTLAIVILVLVVVYLVFLIKFGFRQLELISDLRRVITRRLAEG